MSEDQIFSLAKDEVFSLDKINPGFENYYVGLSWTPAVAGQDIDLDIVLIGVDANNMAIPGKHKECFLFYLNHGRGAASPQAYSITEDNRDGQESNGDIDDDEAVFISGSEVISEIEKMQIFVAFADAGGRTLKDVSEISFRIAPLINGEPDEHHQVTFSVADVGEHEGAFMAELTRNSVKGWDIRNVTLPCGNIAAIASERGIQVK